VKCNPCFTDLTELIIITAWYIWRIRRQKLLGETVSAVNQIVLNIQTLVLILFEQHACLNEKKSESTWMKAKDSFMSVNVDVAFNLDTRRG
jgi:hypothetical protein